MDHPVNAKRENRTGMRRILKRLMWVALSLTVIAAVVISVRPKPVPVEATVVAQGELIVTVDEDGVSRIKDRYVVSAPIAGNLVRVELDPGDIVQAGDVLARILPQEAPLLDARSREQAEARVAAARASQRQAEAQVERARAALDFATEDAESARNLFQRGAVSRQDLERSELELRARQAELTSAEFASNVARHELQMARAALSRMSAGRDGKEEQFEVRSPVTGQVLTVYQKSGGVVQPGTQIIELGKPEALEIAVDVLTSDAVHIRAGARARIEEWGGAPLQGRVRLIEPSAFTRISALGVEEQRVNVVIDLEAAYDEWKALGDGYRVQARIIVYERAEAVQIPWSALFRWDQRWAVFVVVDERAQLQAVEVGRRSDTHAEILEGLQPGQRVVLHPSDRVQDDVRVEILNADALTSNAR